MNNYKQRKEIARKEAMEWQNNFSYFTSSYAECVKQTQRFTKIGKRYGLLKEFRENGII